MTKGFKKLFANATDLDVMITKSDINEIAELFIKNLQNYRKIFIFAIDDDGELTTAHAGYCSDLEMMGLRQTITDYIKQEMEDQEEN